MVSTKKNRGFGWLLMLLIMAAGIYFFFEVLGPNTTSFKGEKYIYVKTGSTYDEFIADLVSADVVNSMGSFKMVAKALKLPDNIHAGKYKVKNGINNYNLVRMLRSGAQVPVRVTIKKLRTKKDLAKVLSKNLEADSAKLMALLSDNEFLSTMGVDTHTAMTIVIPDTYEFYWNTPAEKALKKIESNHRKFWTEGRLQKAKNQGVSPAEAVIVASIVDEETNYAADKPLIASVYLNRIRLGMKLQADPTIKFGIGDFTIKRISGAMLQFNSPYNTYMYPGLPPGPICTPSTASVNAVLDAPKTTYLYFCAMADFSGRTAFASTFREQVNNAQAYHRALNKRGIH